MRASTSTMGTNDEGTRTSCLDFPEHVLGDELLEIHRGFDLPDAPTGLDELFRGSWTDANEFLADEPLRLDRGDRVFLQLNIRVQPEHDVRLVVVEPDRFHPPDLDPGDLHARPRLQPAHRGKVSRDQIAAAAQQRNAPKLDGKVPQCQYTQDDEKADSDVHARALLHNVLPAVPAAKAPARRE